MLVEPYSWLYEATIFASLLELSLMMLHYCIQLRALRQPIHSSSQVTIPVSHTQAHG